jgi:hypothetical protein
MAAASRLPFRPALTAICLVVGLSAAAVSPVCAQGFGWLGSLFGGGQHEAPPPAGGGSNPYFGPPRHPPRRRPPVDSAQDAGGPPPVAKTATVFVDVFGDSLGQFLANGLDASLADKTDVGIVHMARGPSGLVNDTYFNWPKAIADLLARQDQRVHDEPKAEGHRTGGPDTDPQYRRKGSQGQSTAPTQGKIDVAVMMIGSNDRQPIVQDGKRLQPGSDEWNAVYRKRVLAIAEAFAAHKIPLIWVGIPIVKNDDIADDLAALNDIYREVASSTGATYIDTWEAFSDDNGDFAAYGPDINGQTVRLRSADGIYFTQAGARKLAHFVEGQVRRNLDGMTPRPDLPTADLPQSDTKTGHAAVAAEKPEAGPIRKLGDPPTAKDGRLADIPRLKVGEAENGGIVSALVNSQGGAPPAGRADNFKWPPDGTASTR